MSNLSQKFRVFGIGAGILIGITLFTGVYNSPVKPVDASISTIPIQVQLNSMNHNQGWVLSAEKVTLGNVYSDQSKKIASVYLSIQNINGKDKPFLPAGKILGFYGDTGKYYELPWEESLENHYAYSEDIRKKGAELEGKPYQPGIFKIVPQFYVDVAEESITKLIFQDVDGVNYEIPIEKVTEIPPANTGGK